MKFVAPLSPAQLLRRYKRFLADVQCADGSIKTVLCPNTGSLLGCQSPGSTVWLSRSDSPTRKYADTWELIQAESGALVGINTQRSNLLVEEALCAHIAPSLCAYQHVTREVRYGTENSRIDLLLTASDGQRCYVEVKNVTAAVENNVALFPDSVSARASKHLRELMREVARGHRAMVVFCVQREDVREVRPADAIDPTYGKQLREALANGVETLALRASVSPDEIKLVDTVPVTLP